jgi:hypothetical protein
MDILSSAGAWLASRRSPSVILTRHFFGRFFQNDVVSFEDQAKEKVFTGMAFLAILGVQLANALLMKYPFLDSEGPSWVDKCFFLWFFMLLVGLLAVAEWDVIFPDRRDYLNIAPLPVKIRTIFLAKFLSFFLISGIFSLSANAGASLVFGLYLTHFRSSSPLFILRYAAAHLVSSTAANVFFFFLCAFVQGLLMTLLSPRLYSSFTSAFRFLLLTALVFLLIFSVAGPQVLPRALFDLTWPGGSESSLRRAFAPLWFTGLYERLLGNPDRLFAGLARTAVFSVALAVLGFFAAAWLSYGRHLKKSLDVQRGRPAFGRLSAPLSRLFDGLFVRNPTERAVYHFFGLTLRRSPLHKVRLFNYLAASSGLALILLASTRLLRSRLTTDSRPLLSVPLILSFFLLLGVRALSNVPTALEANWVFQLTEREPRRHYITGFKKRVFVSALLPLFSIVFAYSCYLWGCPAALLHSVFGLAASLLLLELLFFRYPKIPFACTYVPGKAKLHLFWLPYLLSFIAYISFFSGLEAFLFRNQRYFLDYFVGIGLVLAPAWVYQNLIADRGRPILFEDRPEPVMIGLDTES